MLKTLIVKNILIALTGVGALCLAGKLIYSKAREGQTLFFSQKDKTTSEEKGVAIKQALDELSNLQGGV